MAENTEVLKYQLDLSDVEAKASRMQTLLGEITKRRAAGENTQELEQKLQGEVMGFHKLGEEVKRAGDETLDFDRKAEKLVKGSLGMMSPQLAQAADFAIDLVQGLGQVNGALLAVAAGGAGIGILISAMNEFARRAAEAAAAVERQEAALSKLREKEVGERSAETQRALKAGLAIDPRVLNREIDTIMKREGLGAPMREIAADVAIARFLADLDESAVRELLAGVARTGGEAIPFEGQRGKDLDLIRRLRGAGRDGDSQRALEAMQLGSQPLSESEIRDALLRRVAESGRFSDRELKLVKRFVREGLISSEEASERGTYPAQEAYQRAFGPFWAMLRPAAIRDANIEGRTFGEIIDEAQRVREEANQGAQRVGGERMRGHTFNVTNIRNGTVIHGPPTQTGRPVSGGANRSATGT